MGRKFTTLEPTEKPKNARMKCDGKGFCWLMQRLFSEPNGKGINVIHVFNARTGMERTIGVAFKQTDRDRGTAFNFCPMCGANLEPLLEAKPRKVAGLTS